MENVQHETDNDEHVEVRVGGKKDKAAPNVPPPEEVIEQTVARDTGVSLSKRGRAPEDAAQGSVGKRCSTDPIAARRRFNVSLLFYLFFLFNSPSFFIAMYAMILCLTLGFILHFCSLLTFFYV